MSSNRGAAGAAKPKLLNVNTVYAGKTVGGKAAGPGSKHGGLQSVGKATAVVRRMPPPATLPSLRAESQGQDPNVALVPQGGSGWNKSDGGGGPDDGSEYHTLKNGGSSSASIANAAGSNTVAGTLPSNASSSDLRPNWAKPTTTTSESTAAGGQLAQLAGGAASGGSSRDFPTLAAAAQSRSGGPDGAGSLKPQKSGTWKIGGVAVSGGGEVKEMTPPPVQPTSVATTKSTERQLPARYGGDVPAAATNYGQQRSGGPAQYGYQKGPDMGMPPPGAIAGRYSQPPPPIHNDVRYSQNALYQQHGNAIYSGGNAYPPPPSVRSGRGDEGYDYGNNAPPPPIQQARSPYYPNYKREPDYVNRGGQQPPPMGYGPPPPPQLQQSNRDGGGANYDYQEREEYGWSDDEAGGEQRESQRPPPGRGRMPPPPPMDPSQYHQPPQHAYRDERRVYDHPAGAQPREDWYASEQHQQYVGTGQWYAAQSGGGGGHQQHGPQPLMAVNTSAQMTYGVPLTHPQQGHGYQHQSGRDIDRELLDDERHKANQEHEREAAIQKSRLKRRAINQGSNPSENEYQPSFGADQPPESDRPNSRDSYGQRSQASSGKHGGGDSRHPKGHGEYDERGGRRAGGVSKSTGDRSGVGGRRGGGRAGNFTVEAAAQPEYRLLKRPDSKDSADSASDHPSAVPHHPKLPTPDEEESNEDDPQLIQLSRPAGKIIKRVAPGDQQQQQSSVQDKPMDQKSKANANSATATGKENKSTVGKSLSAAANASGTAAAAFPAPPPAENIWERRQEERESAERERQSQEAATKRPVRPAQPFQNLQAHFPTVNEPGRLQSSAYDGDNRQSSDVRRYMPQQPYGIAATSRGGNRQPHEKSSDQWYDGANAPSNFLMPPPHHGRTTTGRGGGASGETEEDGDSETDNAVNKERTGTSRQFHGHREFVNSRVSAAAARSGRGMSVGSSRGRMHHHHAAGSTRTRGISAPQGYGSTAPIQPHPRRQQQQPRLDESPQSIEPPSMVQQDVDNFSNMGEFHADDAIYAAALQKASSEKADKKKEKTADADENATKTTTAEIGSHHATNQHRRGDRQSHQRGAGSGAPRGGNRQRTVRASQPLYQPHTGTTGEVYTPRGNRRGRGDGNGRNAEVETVADETMGGGGSTAHFERGKRKRDYAQNGAAQAEPYDNGYGNANYRRGGQPRGGNRSGAESTRRRGAGRTGPNATSADGQSHHHRGGQLKSPAMSEGPEEWETASESSDVANRATRKSQRKGGLQQSAVELEAGAGSNSSHRRHQSGGGNTNQRANPQQRKERPQRGSRRNEPMVPSDDPTKANGNATANASTTGSKNVRPASHTHFAAGNSSHQQRRRMTANESSSHYQQRSSGSETTGMQNAQADNEIMLSGSNAALITCSKSDGLAGVDINNAGVIVIDDQPDMEDTSSAEHDDFEEVLSKKARRARQQQLNEQAEMEKLKKQKEKERIEKAQARRAKLQSRRIEKKAARDAANVASVSITSTIPEENDENAAPAASILQQTTNTSGSVITTVWNSAHVDGLPAAHQDHVLLANHPVIPSPIARPTKSAQSAAVAATTIKPNANWPDEVDSNDELKGKTVEFPPNFVAPTPTAAQTELQTSDKYDFTFDPNLQQPENAADSPLNSKISVVDRAVQRPQTNTNSAATDDARLKEKLDKVKDIWPGQPADYGSGSLLVSSSVPSSGGSVAVENAGVIGGGGGTSEKFINVSTTGGSSLAQGPNVAKVRPQPQTSEQQAVKAAAAAAAAAASSCNVSQPSQQHHRQQQQQPTAILSPTLNLTGTSLHLAPGMTAYSAQYGPYSLMLSGDLMQQQPTATYHHSQHPAVSPPAQAQQMQQMFGQQQTANQPAHPRSRPPGSFMEQQQQQTAFYMHHPPPAGNVGQPLWPTGPMEMMTGMNAGNAGAPSHFQFSMSGRPTAPGGVPASFPASATGKMPPPPPHMGMQPQTMTAFTMPPPPPSSNMQQMANHPGDYMGMPPPLGPVGSQRATNQQHPSQMDTFSGAQMHRQAQHQATSFAPNAVFGAGGGGGGAVPQLFSGPANPAAAFGGQFTAPPPQLHFPRSADATGGGAGWAGKPQQQPMLGAGPPPPVSTAAFGQLFGMKFSGGNPNQPPLSTASLAPIGRPPPSGGGIGRNVTVPGSGSRWNPPQSTHLIQRPYGGSTKDMGDLQPASTGNYLPRSASATGGNSVGGGTSPDPSQPTGTATDELTAMGGGGASTRSLTPSADSTGENLAAIKKTSMA